MRNSSLFIHYLANSCFSAFNIVRLHNELHLHQEDTYDTATGHDKNMTSKKSLPWILSNNDELQFRCSTLLLLLFLAQPPTPSSWQLHRLWGRRYCTTSALLASFDNVGVGSGVDALGVDHNKSPLLLLLLLLLSFLLYSALVLNAQQTAIASPVSFPLYLYLPFG